MSAAVAAPTSSTVPHTWPWPNSKEKDIATGLTRWHIPATEDGTSLELFRIDFQKGSLLSIGLEDLDRFDEKPFDNSANYRDFGIEQFREQIDSRSFATKIDPPSFLGGNVLLIWNGPFFNRSTKDGFGSHIGPVVLNGKKHYNVGSHRWTFGWWIDDSGRPFFKALHMPEWETLENEFTYAADGFQCLVREGKPLKLPLQTDPKFSRPRGGAKSTPQDVGAIPIVDDIKTSRTSIAWSKDNRFLYVLIVSESDTEAGSINAFRRGKKQVGGWNLADLQQFWSKLGVWGAVNSDGGMQTQRTFVDSDSTIDHMSPQTPGKAKTTRITRSKFKPPIHSGGGTLMAFYVFQRKRHPHEMQNPGISE